jgi:hypothetical protein
MLLTQPSQDEFWDFSMDELARYDVPDMVSVKVF